MNTLETRVLELIGESTSSPDVFVDTSDGMAQIRESLNDAIEDICIMTGSHRRTYNIPLKSGKMFYQINFNRDEFAWINNVWLVDKKIRLEQKSLIWLINYNYRFLYNVGYPEFYFPLGYDKIGIHPVPGSDADMMEVDCVAIPGRYELDTDRIKLRNSFQWAAVHFAVSEYWATRGDAKEAIFHFVKFLEKLGMQELYPEAHERHWEFTTEKAQA
jgi:hypothetical protein